MPDDHQDPHPRRHAESVLFEKPSDGVVQKPTRGRVPVGVWTGVILAVLVAVAVLLVVLAGGSGTDTNGQTTGAAAPAPAPPAVSAGSG